ncbi:MAG: GTPase ObgE [Thermoanaerobaculia bacterium]
MIFLDEAVVHVRAGRGGNGCVAFRREKYVPRGGPSGGDGGHGGAVILVGDEGLNTLYHLRYRSIYPAERGRHGEGSNKTGRSGSNLDIKVPPGTQVYDAEDSTPVGEILAHGERLVVAEGGRGGRGNARFATSTNRAPDRADPGEEGAERRLRLELKLLADVGVVGLPNAGKSTLISVISAARPRIADYPFTTLIPQLGVVADGPSDEPFVVADLPGLIEGAAQGAGLGHQFLRHVERCRVLLHLVDLAAETGGAEDDLSTIEHEMEAFDPELLSRPRWIVGTKLDAAREERRKHLRAAASRRGLEYWEISSVSQTGVRELVNGLRQLLVGVEGK